MAPVNPDSILPGLDEADGAAATRRPLCPGLFVTATDTGLGKTTIACAIAWNLQRQWMEATGNRSPSIGVMKPIATGCRRDREGLVSGDAEALAHFSDCRLPLATINPARFAAPLAPAAAAELAGETVDFAAIARSVNLLRQESDVLIVEGIGGLLVPLAPRDRVKTGFHNPSPSESRLVGTSAREREPRAERGAGEGAGKFGSGPQFWTVLDLITALDYPVVIVAAPGLGTLNHTAMTVTLLRQAGCRLAGIVINGYRADDAPLPGHATGETSAVPGPASATLNQVWQPRPDSTATGQPTTNGDQAQASNRLWLPRLAGLPILAIVPACPINEVAPEKGRIPPAILEAVGQTFWPQIVGIEG